ncbi:signal recognition particle-docking protein FtsY [Mycoplasmopsis canis UFG4]|uniref:Signal recognition particle receptor FtsY n=1 Tax=Mycoplasmopsis canis UFG4 TaxID=1131455 RepID=I1A7A5_9BACT|nr:signal recognition particle-docking protein FtsY [Mycoplasmopsis canis]AKF41295.1 cell division protein FtsY [Mycoplasmopsis canis]EIE40819.1 signal recognition particle-docking protein FtsY [Mycoplasmopsis canis UF31]EIE40948.1 signal recognition particle-docking protein FtsY [Mycoplasmopsis canis UF33]EIE42097.1 signal recognition particle-docking protein FtsY [Mycoplasmopsis canis UFG1]EIE42376.1 signal recognition particle-docking protein FtsY [Mycoplasmopsis canis UFG4]
MGFFKNLVNKVFKKENKDVETLKDELKEQHSKEVLNSDKFKKYSNGLENSSSFGKKLLEIQNRYNTIDEDFFDELEELLIMSDINLKLVDVIIEKIKQEVRTNNIDDPKLIGELIADQLFVIYTANTIVDTNLNFKSDRLNVFIFVGVNGSGKTTSIAKMANKYIKEGKKVLIAAADTFRAGAVNQLAVWADRIGAQIVKPQKEGADPASVVFEALEKATNESYDLLIIDTAGRLQNKVNLMNELSKMVSIIQRFIPDAPHESLLVLDATTGQNGLSQAKNFKEIANLTGVILTKLDGTSKGGIVLSIKDEYNLNVKYVGLGEKLDDLQEFDLELFIYQMTKDLIDNV